MSGHEQSRNKVAEASRPPTVTDFHDDLRSYQAAVQANPADVEATCKLAACYESIGQFTQAVDSWRYAARLRPLDANIQISLGEALRQCQAYHSALDAYSYATEADPLNAVAISGAAESLRMLRRFPEALEAFDKALELQPDNTFALRGKAATFNALHKFEQASPLWERSVELDPQSAFAAQGLAEARRGAELGYEEITAVSAPQADESRRRAERMLEWGQALIREQRTVTGLDALKRAAEHCPRWVQAHQEYANALEYHERWADAVEVHRALCELEPDRAESWCSLAECLRKADAFQEAVSAYDRVLELDPKFVFGLAGRAEALRMLGFYLPALDGFEQALSIHPNHAFSLRGKAATLQATGKLEQAQEAWNHAIDVEPDDPFAQAGLASCIHALQADDGSHVTSDKRRSAQTHLDIARALLHQRRIDEGLASVARAQQIDPTWLAPWMMKGQLLAADSQHLKAHHAFAQCLKLQPSHHEAALLSAESLRKHQDLDAALAAYELVLDLNPDSIPGIAGLAETLRMKGKHSAALQHFSTVLDNEPTHLMALCGAAGSLNALRRYEAAHEYWIRARDVEPGSSFIKRGLRQCLTRLAEANPEGVTDLQYNQRLSEGRVAQRAGDLQKAVQLFEQAIQEAPSRPMAYLRLGIVLEDLGRYDDAIDRYQHAMHLDPQNHQAATNVGECYRKMDRYRDALTAYDHALVLKVGYLYAVAGKAECLRMMNQHEEALQLFDEALSEDRNHVFAVQGKAATLNALKRFPEALAYWERALACDPSSKFALEGKTFCIANLRVVRSDGQTIALPNDASESSTPESPTPTIDEQGRDLTALARAGDLPDVIGRTQEIRSVMKTLVRRQKANPLLIGEPGVGKTAIVEGVARALSGDNVPSRLRGLRIVELSMGNLVAGTKYRGVFEERLNKIIDEAKNNPGTVLFIDEIHTLVGAGRTEGGSLDAANLLKPALARGEITVIGATTIEEYRKHIESDSALDRRFQPVRVEEPNSDESLELLGRVKGRYEQHHGVEVSDAALDACVTLSVRYVPDRRLPDKALDLLDEACAEASLSEDAVVTPLTVAAVMSERTGIPAGQLSEADRALLLGLEQRLTATVKGQQQAVETIAKSVRLARSGLRRPDRPRGVYLFVGPSGVGKTELARSLSDTLFPEGNAFLRFDMSEYSDKFTMSRLIGAPPGYAGHGEAGQLTERLRRRPYAVVLLDEFEKAHPEVQTLFLSLFDEGRLTDSEGRTVDARQAIFILTSNAGTDHATKSRVGFGGQSNTIDKGLVLEGARQRFRPELLNRIDEVVAFSGLDSQALTGIVSHHLDKLAQRAAESGLTFTWDNAVVEHIAMHNEDRMMGARPALRAIEREIAEDLGVMLLRQEVRAVHASMVDGCIRLTEQ